MAFIGAYTALQPFGVPGTVFVVAAPLIWPWPAAFALSMVGTMGASVVGFSFARFLARDWVSQRIPARFRRYEEALARRGFATVFFLRLVFWMPRLLHSFLGVSRVPFWTHFWGSLLGYVPPLLLVSYFGQRAFDWMRAAPASAWVGIAAGVVVVVGVAAWRKRRRCWPSCGAALPRTVSSPLTIRAARAAAVGRVLELDAEARELVAEGVAAREVFRGPRGRALVDLGLEDGRVEPPELQPKRLRAREVVGSCCEHEAEGRAARVEGDDGRRRRAALGGVRRGIFLQPAHLEDDLVGGLGELAEDAQGDRGVEVVVERHRQDALGRLADHLGLRRGARRVRARTRGRRHEGVARQVKVVDPTTPASSMPGKTTRAPSRRSMSNEMGLR